MNMMFFNLKNVMEWCLPKFDYGIGRNIGLFEWQAQQTSNYLQWLLSKELNLSIQGSRRNDSFQDTSKNIVLLNFLVLQLLLCYPETHQLTICTIQEASSMIVLLLLNQCHKIINKISTVSCTLPMIGRLIMLKLRRYLGSHQRRRKGRNSVTLN